MEFLRYFHQVGHEWRKRYKKADDIDRGEYVMNEPWIPHDYIRKLDKYIYGFDKMEQIALQRMNDKRAERKTTEIVEGVQDLTSVSNDIDFIRCHGCDHDHGNIDIELICKVKGGGQCDIETGRMWY